jgi:PhoH-like ATPase
MQKNVCPRQQCADQAPHALLSFEDNRIVIPVPALEELDGLKNEEGVTGARCPGR